MKAIRRISATLFLLAALTAPMALPAFAQENSPKEAAVPVTTVAPAATQLDWTYRYMIPAALALGVIVTVITAGQYFTSVVRKRYRIVDE
jgi:hypothetical protein